MDLARTLVELQEFAGAELASVERLLQSVPARPTVVGRCLQHLLTLQGKRLRPLCVVLAARLARSSLEEEAPPSAAAVRILAAAVELVHSATLLHDDVVDLGEVRRGRPTGRALYGNAASVFAGDWLLIEALRRVSAVQVPGVMDRLLEVIDQMISAEAEQLELRGRVDANPETYFRVVHGKTAVLFEYALFAGARAAGLPAEACEPLVRYGRHLGLAFQIVDDVLDLAGDPAKTGKTLFTDLSEGRLTLPLLFAAPRDPSLVARIEEVLAADGVVPPDLRAKITQPLRTTEAIEAARQRAIEEATLARQALEVFPAGPARFALERVADASIARTK